MKHFVKMFAFLMIASLLTGCGGGNEEVEAIIAPTESSTPAGETTTVNNTPAETNNSEPEPEKTRAEPDPEPETSTENTTIGTFSGVIKFQGEAPILAPLFEKGAKIKDAIVCAVNPIPDQSLVVNPENNGIANVFLFMKEAPEGTPEVKPSPVPIVFDHDGCKFEPHAISLLCGETVKAINSDGVAHNVHTNPIKNFPLNQVLQAKDSEGLVMDFPKSEIVPVKIVCDFHPWMVSWIFPLDHPFAAVTDADGNFEIKNLPPGTHTFRIWQEKVGYLDKAYEVTIGESGNEPVVLEYAADVFEEKE